MGENENKGKKASVEELLECAIETAQRLLKKRIEGVVKVERADKKWSVVIEALERKAVPDTQDILGRYAFAFDDELNLLGYEQTMLRRRASLDKVEKE